MRRESRAVEIRRLQSPDKTKMRLSVSSRQLSGARHVAAYHYQGSLPGPLRTFFDTINADADVQLPNKNAIENVPLPFKKALTLLGSTILQYYSRVQVNILTQGPLRAE